MICYLFLSITTGANPEDLPGNPEVPNIPHHFSKIARQSEVLLKFISPQFTIIRGWVLGDFYAFYLSPLLLMQS